MPSAFQPPPGQDPRQFGVGSGVDHGVRCAVPAGVPVPVAGVSAAAPVAAELEPVPVQRDLVAGVVAAAPGAPGDAAAPGAAVAPTGPVPSLPAAPSRLPAPRRRAALTHAQRDVTPAEEASFSVIEHECGGRAVLVQVLGGADLNADEGRVVGMMADPANDGVSLAKICALGGFKLARLMKLFQAATLTRAQVKAIARVAEKLPDVAAGVMEDAIQRLIDCVVCEGTGEVPGRATKDDLDPPAVKCSTCKGKGLVQFRPDTEVRKMALQIGGLLDKGHGTKVLVQNNNLNAGLGDPGSYDSLMDGLDRVLYGAARDRARRGGGGAVPAAVVVDGDVGE